MKKEEYAGKFCKFNDTNFSALSEKFPVGRIKRCLSEYKNIYVTSDLDIALTSLSREELIKLKLQEIELIDGFWYNKSELEN